VIRRPPVTLVAWALLGLCLRSPVADAHTLGDLVFCDANGDGVFEPPDDTGIAGVTVVRDCAGTVTTTMTDTAGRYAFLLTKSGTCRVYVDSASAALVGLTLSTPRAVGPPPPTAEHSPFPGFGCGSCPNAFVTTVPADGVFETTIDNPCNCTDPACPPTGTDPCAGPAPFVGYYGDDFGFVCTTSTTSSTSSSTTATTQPSTTTTSSTTSTTTTTVPCGNGIVTPPEQCDPPGSLTCPSTSPGGAFVACQADCSCPGCPLFPFLIRTVGKIGNDGQVTGSIGANDAGGDFHFGKNVFQSDASTVAADHLGLGEGTSVANALGKTLRKGRGAVVRGQTGIPVLPLTTPFCPIPDFACSSAAVTVLVGDSTGPLPPGTYGTLTILRNGTLTLAPGTFEFCSLRTSKRATINVTGTEQTTINIVGTFRLADGSTLVPAPGTPTPRINIAGPYMRVSHRSTLQAFVSAPSALLTLGRYATINGTFCVNQSQSDKRVKLTCPPPSPGGAFLEDGPGS
jgi:hypothetical protein